jgi:amidase
MFALPETTSPDPLGAFVTHAPYALEGYRQSVEEGPLTGLNVGIKDLFDVAGLKTGNGSPAWLAEAEPAGAHAPVVAALLDAGAKFVGKTLTDELAWSLNGENVHYGTPVNVAAPGRIPGGSSAGSAAAVAGSLADFALGSDTGGSVRLPASYCGIWGSRPTHGRISLEGAMALAPSFDTAGWFARTPHILSRVGGVLLNDEGKVPADITHMVVAEDLFGRVEETVRDGLLLKVRALAEHLDLTLEFLSLSAMDREAGGSTPWRDVFRIVQSAEVWQVHGAWVEAANPSFGPGIKERFAMAKGLGADEVSEAKARRVMISGIMESVTPPGTLLVVPGAAGVAPLKGLSGPAVDDVRARALDVLCPAGSAGQPQLAMPAFSLPDGPVGLGLIAWRGGDEALLGLAEDLQRMP